MNFFNETEWTLYYMWKKETKLIYEQKNPQETNTLPLDQSLYFNMSDHTEF